MSKNPLMSISTTCITPFISFDISVGKSYIFPDSAKLKIHPLHKMPKIRYNKGIRIAEKQHQKGEEENAENRDSNKR